MRNVNCIVLSILVLFVPMAALAGNLDSPAAPTDADSAMYTLEDIYNRLNDGSAGSKRLGAFAEPLLGPTAGTGHTLDDLMGKAPSVDDTNGAGVVDVLADKTFWGLTSGNWGVKTGTVTAGNNVSGADGSKTFNIPDGLYSASKTATANDTNLTAENIKSGVTIFGVQGNRHGGCDCSGGTLNGTRWCDNGNGTVTDLTTCLVWLIKADWGGAKAWREEGDWTHNNDAHTRAGLLKAGDYEWLTDNSDEGDWRLPTKTELYGLAHGTEAVSFGSPRLFTGVQPYDYWSSTTHAIDPYAAWNVYLCNGSPGPCDKIYACYVWPVRGGQ